MVDGRVYLITQVLMEQFKFKVIGLENFIFSKSFQDDQGNFETSMSLSGEPYKVGVTAPNTETETPSSPAEFNFMLIHDGIIFILVKNLKLTLHPLVSRMLMELLS